ncbi:MAG: proton-conducting transporter membrane subunit [Coriobacteriia bacterium]|nr:proton-conducting transporter membrane subunit [Coriobacteriia bacterium]
MSEAITAQLPAIALAVLLLAAPAAFLAGGRAARALSIVAATIETAVALWIAVAVAVGGPLYYRIGGWGAPLGIDLRVDGLAAVMIALSGVVGLAVTVYAAGYFGAEERYRFFWPLWLMLWASLVALFASNDAFNLYVCLELVSVSAVALVSITGSRAALSAAMRYLLAAILGSLFYLFGVAMLYGAAGVLDLDVLGQVIRATPAAQAGLALALTGLVIKTALVPMHFWLPPAHANAASPVSAVLSALVVKGSFYIALRLYFAVAGTLSVSALAQLLGILGAVAIVWGSIQAFTQTRLKMLVAYSTVAQIGYLFVLFPLVAASTEASSAATAVSAGVFHALSHALAKSAMFLAAGAVLVRFGHDRIGELHGLARRAPAQAFAFGLAGVSMLGLPPSGGFVSKWLYITAALETGAWPWAAVVLGGGLLAAAYVFRVVGIFMAQPLGDTPLADAHPALSWVPLALALASVFLGVFGQPVLDLIAPAIGMLVQGVVS